METFGIIILAAGASTRLGEPKQLLHYNGKSLLRHTIEIALEVISSPVFVVLGAQSHLLLSECKDLPVLIVENKNWKLGMGSSIHAGVSAMTRSDHVVDNVILLVCDQPFISSAAVNELIVLHKKTQAGIVACSYDNTVGIPALFNKKYYDELLQLEGVEGAKKIINKHVGDVSTVSFPMGFIDVDTASDYQRLLSNSFDPPTKNI